MRVSVIRKNVKFTPDSSRVVARYFMNGDQRNLEKGEKRIIISFRATGEGHISSIVFRRGVLDKNNDLQMVKVGGYIDKAEVSHKKMYNKKRFVKKLLEMHIPDKYSTSIM